VLGTKGQEAARTECTPYHAKTLAILERWQEAVGIREFYRIRIGFYRLAPGCYRIILGFYRLLPLITASYRITFFSRQGERREFRQ